MKIAFTICSNNYLSLARALGKSLLSHNPEYTFFIGLVDKLNPEINQYYQDFEVIPCSEIGLKELDEMAKKYSIAEFNTAVKPFYFTYFHERFPDVKQMLFVDPDMLVYDRLTDLDTLHASYDILLTPHILHPMPLDGKNPSEISYLATGTFNLGFLSLKMSPITREFLQWWSERLKLYCTFDFAKGLFVDQKWVNLVPVFFNSVYIIRNPGYNIAYWNIHERKVEWKNGTVRVNNDFPLVIYHFSSVNIKAGKLFYKQQDRFVDEDFPEVVRLFEDYRNKVLAEGYLETNKLSCYYVSMHEEHLKEEMKKRMDGRLKLFFKAIIPKPVRQNVKQKLKKLIGD
jgi:hypothetical protein